MSPEATEPSGSGSLSSAGLEDAILQAGGGLLESFGEVLDRVPESTAGPQRLSGALGIDKVLASRLLKTMRSPDAMTAAYRAPGPDPMRRVLLAAGKAGVDPKIIETARAAVDAYERLIKVEVGDRSALDAILSAWVPEAREEFETRRKQAAFRAMSQLRGAEVASGGLTVIFVPNPNGQHIDMVGLRMLFGLQRLRPDAPVWFTSHMVNPDSEKEFRLTNLEGQPITTLSSTMIEEFSTQPTPEMKAKVYDRTAHYRLAGKTFGTSSMVDVVTCEIMRAAIKRYADVSAAGRRAGSSMTIGVPSKLSQFDVLVHEDAFPGQDPEFHLYDTAVYGQANVNDETRTLDQLDLLADVVPLGHGIQSFGSAVIPRYRDLLKFVYGQLGFQDELFRGYRVASEYPVYGSQFVLSFQPTPQPAV